MVNQKDFALVKNKVLFTVRFGDSIARVQEQLIKKTYRKFPEKRVAARILGLSYDQFLRKLKSYGIMKPRVKKKAASKK